MNPTTTTQSSSTRPVDTTNNESKKTFAGVTATEHKPQRDHAIIIEALPFTKIDEYLSALATIINPSRIKYISKIANARICVFFASKSDADQITNNYRTIKVNNITTPIRPLIMKHTKVIISNVCPVIPNSLILNELAKYEITPSTSIVSMRAAATDKRFAHILSFRRTFLIEPEKIHKLPESLLINWDDTNFRIFLNVDSESCYICKKHGHYAKNCILGNNNQNNTKLTTTFPPEIDTSGNNTQQPQEVVNNQNTKYEIHEKSTTNLLPTQNKENNAKDNRSQFYHNINSLPEVVNTTTVSTKEHPTLVKRQLSITSTSTTPANKQSEQTSDKIDKIPPKKRTKTHLDQLTTKATAQKSPYTNPKPTMPSNYYETAIESTRHLIEKVKLVEDLTFDLIKDIFLKCFESTNPAKTCDEHNFDIEDLICLAPLMHEVTEDKILKCKITRLRKKIEPKIIHPRDAQESFHIKRNELSLNIN